MKKPFDKYELYIASVQSPDADVRFFSSTYKDLRNKTAHSLREDFCGTFLIASTWVKKHSKNRAVGLDLDPEPIAYGKKHSLELLNEDQKRRLHIYRKDVLTVQVEKVDIIVAMNFSYYLFKKREQLKRYFTNALAGLKRNGIFIVDCFGGPACMEVNEEKRKITDFYYYWDQSSYNPIRSEAKFHIHFQRKGERKRLNLFNYDWRMWTMPELRELMLEVGFKKTEVYWEGTSQKTGEGNGRFRRTEKGENCDAWVAYVVGSK